MLRLIGIVISVGLADSLNPSTLAPALYLASGPEPRKAVSQFTLGVFGVYLVGGIAVAAGPGQLVLALVPSPSLPTRHVLEVIAGVVLIAVGLLLWVHRARLAEKQLPSFNADGRGAFLLGVTIMVIELPTAFPYFGVLAAIVGSGFGIVRQLLLIALFNVCFVAPLLGILAILTFAGDHAQQVLGRARDFLQHHWPILLAVVAVIGGAITIALGATGTYHQVRRVLR
jgi:cytochrome c biogenesis protein CcdA